MGKAKILSHKGEGLYSVELTYDKKSLQRQLDVLNKDIVLLNALVLKVQLEWVELDAALKVALVNPQLKDKERMAAANAAKAKKLELGLLQAKRSQCQKDKAYVEKYLNKVWTTDAWCADYSKTLTGDVDTIEVAGKIANNQNVITVQVAPEGKTTTKSILKQIQGIDDAPAVYNWAMVGGWQKFKPTYRTATITTIDYNAHTCRICLDDVQDRVTGKNVNQPGDGECSSDSTNTPTLGYLDFCSRRPTHAACTNCTQVRATMTPALWAALQTIQRDVNKYSYAYDESVHGRMEYWEEISVTSAGDCEDYALEKLRRAVVAGFPAGSVWVEGGFRADGAGHAWLVVHTTTGDWALDNLQQGVVRNEDQPYTDRIQFVCGAWEKKANAISGVTIKYKTCNSSAFKVGDKVVVEFQNQDWKQPRVIGFVEHPKPCECFVDCGPGVIVLDLPSMTVGEEHVDNKCDVDKPGFLTAGLTEPGGANFDIYEGGPCGKFMRVRNYSGLNCPPYDYTIHNWVNGCQPTLFPNQLYFSPGARPLESNNFSVMWVHRNDPDPNVWWYVVRAINSAQRSTWDGRIMSVKDYEAMIARPAYYSGRMVDENGIDVEVESGQELYNCRPFKARFYDSTNLGWQFEEQYRQGMQIDWFVCKWWNDFESTTATYDITIDLTKWHWSCVTFQNGNTAKIYLNGELKVSTTGISKKTSTVSASSENVTTGNIRPFGFFVPGPSQDCNTSFRGDIGYLAIWDRAITGDEAATIYNSSFKDRIAEANGEVV